MMFCTNCGKELMDGAMFCTNCGAQQPAAEDSAASKGMEKTMGIFDSVPNTPQPQPGRNQQPYSGVAEAHHGSVSFGEAIKLFFVNYANFTGRSSCSEYWWAFLFVFPINFVCAFIPYISQLVALGFLLPTLSIAVRRLHDIGKSWVWYLMALIPLAGPIILIVYFCKESDGDNQWGPGPQANIKYAKPAYTNNGGTGQQMKQSSAQPGRAMTDNDIIAMAQKHEPINLNTLEAKQYMDRALGEIIANYTGAESLTSVLMLYSPDVIKGNIAATDTDTLFVIFKALGYYMAMGGDKNILGLVQNNVLQTLKARF